MINFICKPLKINILLEKQENLCERQIMHTQKELKMVKISFGKMFQLSSSRKKQKEIN